MTVKTSVLVVGCVTLFFLCVCQTTRAQIPPLLVPEPGPTNSVLPILQKPFAGDFEISNFLDHNVPQEFVDANGTQINWWGETTSFFDGHQGYDFLMPEGTPLLAAVEGQIVLAGLESPFFCPPLNKLVAGLWVRIRHQTATGEIFDVDAGHLS